MSAHRPSVLHRLGQTDWQVMDLEHWLEAALCVLLPFFGTALGAAAVFFLRHTAHPRVLKALLGFSSGVMLAAMVWSLLLPAMEMAKSAGMPPWLPAVTGFSAGVWGLLWLDHWLAHRPGSENRSMLALAVTLHNLPEGMAVGVALAGMLAGDGLVTMAGTAALSLGIAVQNVPEGAILSAPLAAAGKSKLRAFGVGALSGVVEPIGALLTLLLTRQVTALLPYVLSFAAGCMLYVVVVELIPETQRGERSSAGAVGTALGFALMMLLDVALG